MISFTDFISKHALKNEATTNIKIQEVLDVLRFPSVGIYMRDDDLTTKSGIVNLHPSKGTHWVLYTNQYYFDSYGCPPPINILNQIKDKHGVCTYSEYKIQKDDSLCASYCLYVLYMSDIIGFKRAVLNLYYQKLSIINETNSNI